MSRQTLFVAMIMLAFVSGMLPAQQSPGTRQPVGNQPLPGTRQPAAGQQPIQVQQPVGVPHGPPEWFPLSPDQDKYLNDVLKYWEYQASQIQRYRCEFTRWEYDPIVLPKYPEIAATVARGTIQFAAPDKGLFKVEKLWQVVIQQQGNTAVPALKDGKPEYSEPKEILGEHWVCDGKSTFQFDARNKKLIKRELPPDMQGKQIAEGPLPFLFGAKAEVINDRYWIRVVAPPPKEKHFWLEAFPKRREEAADYEKVEIVIDDQEFLPTAIILHERSAGRGSQGGRTTYEFVKREKNWSMLPAALNPFHQQFFAPALPAGWQLVNEPFKADPVPTRSVPNGPVTKAPPIGPAPPPRQAQGQPVGPPRR